MYNVSYVDYFIILQSIFFYSSIKTQLILKLVTNTENIRNTPIYVHCTDMQISCCMHLITISVIIIIIITISYLKQCTQSFQYIYQYIEIVFYLHCSDVCHCYGSMATVTDIQKWLSCFSITEKKIHEISK